MKNTVLITLVLVGLLVPSFGQGQLPTTGAGPGAAVATPPIALDATSNSGADQSNVSSISWSHTVTTSGTNLLLAVGVISDASGANASAVSGVTYNGVSMTLATVGADTSGTVRMRAYIFYLTAPSTGSNTIVVSASIGSSQHIKGWAISLTGVNQSSPLDTSQSSHLNSSASLTTTANNDWIVDCIGGADPASLSTSAGQTSKWSQIGSLSDGGGSVLGPVSPGSNTVSWNNSGATVAYAAAAFTP
jgi:hypothetical protein